VNKYDKKRKIFTSLKCLKEALRAWYNIINYYLQNFEFSRSPSGVTLLYVKLVDENLLLLLLLLLLLSLLLLLLLLLILLLLLLILLLSSSSMLIIYS